MQYLDFKRCFKAFVLCDVRKTKLCNVEVLTCAKFEFYSYKRIFPNILDDEWKNLIRNVDIKKSGTYFLNRNEKYVSSNLSFNFVEK